MNFKSLKSQAGFTLVELAIVMIVIGLLIGGVLKGQELVGNAKVTATVAQIKGMDGAISTFRDMYRALPGDMTNPGGRIPNCTALGDCSTAGDADGRLETAPGAVPANEAARFFVQLSSADLLTGIRPDGGTVFGGIFPESKINGGFTIGSAALPGDLTNAINSAGARSGLYLTLLNDPTAVSADGTVVLTANQAYRIDDKFDDGLPNAGSVRAFGSDCAGGGVGDIYLEADAGELCGLHLRVQN